MSFRMFKKGSRFPGAKLRAYYRKKYGQPKYWPKKDLYRTLRRLRQEGKLIEANVLEEQSRFSAQDRFALL